MKKTDEEEEEEEGEEEIEEEEEEDLRFVPASLEGTCCNLRDGLSNSHISPIKDIGVILFPPFGVSERCWRRRRRRRSKKWVELKKEEK